MLIVLDTNVLVSAILTPTGPAHQIIQLVLRGDIQLCVDGRIVAEYQDVLARGRFSFSPRATGRLLGSLLEESQQVLPASIRGRFVDESDRAFIEVAISGKAAVLITGNIKHFHAAQKLGILVKTSREFLESKFI